jgi:hypothetical protein
MSLASVGERARAVMRGGRSTLLSRSTALGIIGIAAAIFLAHWFGKTLPVRSWFVFDLATIWAWQLCLNVACAVGGYPIVRRLLPVERTPLETVAISFPVGVVMFVLGIYAGGYLHLLGPGFAVTLPALMILAGARPVLAAWRAARATDPTAPTARIGGLPLAITVVGVLAAGIIYMGAMAPDAVNYDASWNHLVIAQDYARTGRIVSFPADWNRNFPHLGSVLNSWAFQLPGLRLPQLRWMMALHDEFTVFVWTLVGIAAAARWMIGREVHATWVAFILFPGIFVFDNNLGGSADHFVALFAAPLLLVTGMAFARMDRGTCVLWGVLAGGALLTKIQGVYIVLPGGLLLLARTGVLALRWRSDPAAAPSPRALSRTLVVMGLASLGVLLPHLAGNLVFYRNPFYPLAQDLIPSTPTYRDAAQHVNTELITWYCRAPSAFVQRVTEAVKVMGLFAFAPRCGLNEQPTFGSTFPLVLPFLFFVRRPQRLWLGAAIAVGAVATFASTYWIIRNLQTATPALIAVTAALLVRAWDTAWPARVGVALLVGVQVAWGVPLYFDGAGRINSAMNLFRSGSREAADAQLKSSRSEYVALGEALPKDAKLVIHSGHVSLGIDRTTLLDAIGFEGLIDYREMKTPREMFDRLKSVGATHVVWTPGDSNPHSPQEEILFDVLASRQEQRWFSRLSMFELKYRPREEKPYRAVTIGVTGYRDGLYPIEALVMCTELAESTWRPPAPAETADDVTALIAKVPVVMTRVGQSLPPAAQQRLDREFRQLTSYHDVHVYLRLDQL